MATFTHHKDLLIECPFNKDHKIVVRNQIKHIIDCEKKIVSKFSVCIYNASHRMARHEFAHHIKSCPDGRQHLREASKSVKTEDSELKANGSQLSSSGEIVTDSQPTVLQDSDEDEWADDNCPTYDIYDGFKTTDDIPTEEKVPQKLTKNQKKRNRRKAAIASKDSNETSIWD